MKKTEQKKRESLFNIQLGRVSLVDKALLAKHLSVMLKSGLSLSEALTIAASSARSKLRRILVGVGKSVESGNSLSQSFARYPKVFSGLFVNATKAGEVSGTLVENLENIATELEKEKEMSSKIIGAMVYPSVVLVAAFVLGMILSFVVLPKITPLFEGLRVDLPFTTRWLISFSHFIQGYGLIFFVGIIASITLLLWLIRQKFSRPVTHKLLLTVPIIKSVSRNANLARFTRTLGMLLKSGIRIDEALMITRDTTANYYYNRAIANVARNIRTGSRLSDNLAHNSDYFPILVTKMIEVGEQSGRFEETLFYLSDFYESKVDSATKALSTAIEPLLLIFIGLTVGFLALSIIAPIYDITGNINR
jgi:type IV pilus assembly protein PilC